MQRTTPLIVLIAIVATAIALMVPADQAGAYALGTTSAGSASGSLNDLLSPFGNFINNLNNINGGSLVQPQPISVPALPQAEAPGPASNIVQRALQSFDSWFYGMAEFHIENIIIASLSVFSWVLGVLKSGVDWILGLIR